MEFLSFKGGCTGSPESTLVKIPHCWKSHVMVHIIQVLTVRRLTALVNQTVTTEVSVTTTMIPQDVRTVMLGIWDQPAMMNVFMELLTPTIPCVFVHRPAITVLVAI